MSEPKTVAIIMDGNGRWATEKNLDRTAGHAAGEYSLSKSINWALENKYDFIFQMDADLSHNPINLIEMLLKLKKDL